MVRDQPGILGGTSSSGTSLVELLDRVVHRGAYVGGDVVISLAGIDLVRLDLRLLLTAVQPTDAGPTRTPDDLRFLSPPRDGWPAAVRTSAAASAGSSSRCSTSSARWWSARRCAGWTPATSPRADRTARPGADGTRGHVRRTDRPLRCPPRRRVPAPGPRRDSTASSTAAEENPMTWPRQPRAPAQQPGRRPRGRPRQGHRHRRLRPGRRWSASSCSPSTPAS